MGETRYPALGGELYAEADDPESYADETPELDFYDHDAETEERDPPKNRPPPPAIETPSTFQYDIRERETASPARSVIVNGDVVPADRDITVRSPSIGVETVDLTLWNLDVQTWRGITQGDDLDIELGWNGVFTTTVSRSAVVTKRRRGSGADRAFIIRGVGRNGQMLKRREYSSSFNNLPPHQIVELVANDLGLGVGYISRSSTPLDGYYALSKRKTVRSWFNRLADLAAEQTGRRWVWYVEQGELYFHPAGEQTSQPIKLGIGKSVIRATPVGESQSRSDHPYEIVMRCEPSIRRGMAVTIGGVDNISPNRRYRVQSLVHNSSTTEGGHHTTVVVTPIVASESIYGQPV